MITASAEGRRARAGPLVRAVGAAEAARRAREPERAAGGRARRGGAPRVPAARRPRDPAPDPRGGRGERRTRKGKERRRTWSYSTGFE